MLRAGTFWPGSGEGSVEEVGWAVFGPAELAEQDSLRIRQSVSKICGSPYLVARVPERKQQVRHW